MNKHLWSVKESLMKFKSSLLEQEFELERFKDEYKPIDPFDEQIKMCKIKIKEIEIVVTKAHIEQISQRLIAHENDLKNISG